MKKIIFTALAAVAAVLTMSCASTNVKGSQFKGNAPVMKSSKIEIRDYQGASFGSAIPQWVILVSEGQYSSAVLSEAMPDVKGKKVFVAVAQGDNLEFVKQWTDLVDIEVQVGDAMQRVVGKAVSASEQGKEKESGKDSGTAEISRKLDMYKEAVSTVEVNGLEKTASYWIEKKVTDSDKSVKDVFEYYSVWTMDQENFDRQLEAAMKNVKDNTSEGEELKETLKTKLSKLMITSNTSAVEDEAYDAE